MERIKESSSIHLGLDIGIKNAKVAIVDESGQVLYLNSVPMSSNPSVVTRELLAILQQEYPLDKIATAAVTGKGQSLYKGQEGWQVFTSSYAAIAGLKSAGPGTIIEIGGQNSQVTDPGDGEGKPWRFSSSPLCAAGTGQFLEQQARRVNITIVEFGDRALQWTDKPPRIATRCSVFAKSDLIHLQQKGWPVEAMLAGLSDSVARMIMAQWRSEFKEPIYLIGGVAANKGVQRALSNVLGGKEIIVPDNFDKQGAIGAAILSRGGLYSPKDFNPRNREVSQLFYIPNSLRSPDTSGGWESRELEPGITDVYLGIDVGSTSTKIVVINSDGKVLAKKYVMTEGQPLKAIQGIMADP